MKYEINVIWPNWYSDGMIGKGSYGEVIRIKSKENEQQRSEAVKILRFPQDLSEIRELQNRGIDAEEFYHEIAEKAKKEIVMMSKLQEMNAENVVNIKDHKMIENGIQRIIYIRMELLDSLENNRNIILKQKDKIVDSVVKLGIDICTALSNCEKLSIIHRDIKPSNIFVDKNGTYKLGDFGVSKQEIDKTRGMMTQQGTPMYEAPEVYRRKKYDHTIDVYSLGLVMYEMLNQGRLPYYPLPPKKVTFNDINIATFKRMNKENEMAGPSEADERLSKIILKACSYEPGDRYQSAEEMKKDLRDYQKRTIILNNDKKELFDQTRNVIGLETPLEKKDEINAIWPDWHSDGMVGKGSYGEVIRIKSKENEQWKFEAVKILRFPQDLSEIRELQNRGIDAGGSYHEITEKIKNEIVMMAKLQKMNAENVVNIKDHKIMENDIQRIIYIRMELLDSLKNNRNIILNQKNKIIDSVVKLGIDICTALSNCEKLSIIHRDIKPSNIFVDKNGAYKLGDFGVSKQEIDKIRGEATQQGIPMYEAPEVYRGDNYDHTIDIYSLGLVMYEMLNQGRLPYYPLPPKKVTNNDINIATFKRMKKENEMAAPSEADKELSNIILKACSYEPRDRYQSAEEMKKDLYGYQKEKERKHQDSLNYIYELMQDILKKLPRNDALKMDNLKDRKDQVEKKVLITASMIKQSKKVKNRKAKSHKEPKIFMTKRKKRRSYKKNQVQKICKKNDDALMTEKKYYI